MCGELPRSWDYYACFAIQRVLRDSACALERYTIPVLKGYHVAADNA